MSRKKSLVQMLAACEKYEFDNIVKIYLREIYSYKRIVQTDGKDDCGLDIKVFDLADQMIQYQMTIQKSGTSKEKQALKNKIFEDVAKAKINKEEYGWSGQLLFFYSYELTNKVIRDYQNMALRDYGISLEIIDANRIAEESEEYIGIQQAIYSTSDLTEFKLKESLYDDENNNLIYDLVSFGQSVDIKYEIVESYILRCLYDNQSMDFAAISDMCSRKFSTKENSAFYLKLLQNLYNIKGKISYKKDDKTYKLTKDTYEEITCKLEKIKIDEQQFLNQIGNILSTLGQEDYIDDYISFLKNIYIECFNKRIIIQNDIDSTPSLNRLLSYVKKKLKDENVSNNLVRELIHICDNNKYLQKICASYIFSQKVSINNLQKYAKERKQVFIDTTIALFL